MHTRREIVPDGSTAASLRQMLASETAISARMLTKKRSRSCPAHARKDQRKYNHVEQHRQRQVHCAYTVQAKSNI